MPAETSYFDTSYLVRLYLRDWGFEHVREMAGSAFAVASAWHARVEVIAALHRAFREGRLQPEGYAAALDQFTNDSRDGLYRWLPLNDALQQRLEDFYRNAGPGIFVRAADALHLACAREHGFGEVYSNDRHFLEAAPYFGLRGINIIAREGA